MAARISLLHRIVLLVTVAIVPAVLIQFANEIYLRDARLAELEGYALRQAQLIAGDKDDIIVSGSHFIRAVGEIGEAVSGDDCSTVLDRLDRTYRRFVGMGILARDGRILCGSRIDPEIAAAILAVETPPGEMRVGGFVRTPTGIPALPLVQALPTAPGRPAALGWLLLDLNWLNRNLHDRPMTPGATVAIVDRHGTVLAKAPGDHGVSGVRLAGFDPQRGTWRGTEAGTERIYAVVPLEDQPTGLYVIAGIPVQEVLAPIQTAMRGGMLLIGLGALLTVLLAWFGARRVLIRPLARLGSAAERWRAGDYAPDPALERAPPELRRLNDALNGAIAALAERERDLVQAREELSAANRAKTRLMAAAGHDLKQPLQAIVLTLAGVMPGVGPQQRSALEMASRAARRLGMSLDTLLEASRMETGQLRPEVGPVAAGDLLSELRDQWSLPAKDKGLRLTVVDSSLVMRSDGRLLAMMVNNLVANALRYTERGGIVVGCRPAGDEVRLVVADSGIGIPADKLAAIFEEYAQVDPARRQGFGLGLSIVRGAAALLGHRVSVRSRPGHGSVFEIAMPRYGARVPAEAGLRR